MTAFIAIWLLELSLAVCVEQKVYEPLRLKRKNIGETFQAG